MIYFLLAWYLTALWIIWRTVEGRSEVIAATIAAILGPFVFPVVIACRAFLSEKRKWEISNYYRDNWPPKKYTIDREDITS